jgi:hypothetical protein
MSNTQSSNLYDVVWSEDRTTCWLYRDDILAVALRLEKSPTYQISYTFLKNGDLRPRQVVPVMSYRTLLGAILSEMLCNWNDKKKPQHSKITKWAATRFSKSLGKALYPIWKELLSQMPELHYQVLKKHFSVVGPGKFHATSEMLSNPSWYESADPYIIQDLLKYNAPHYLFIGNVIYYNYYKVKPCLKNWRTQLAGGSSTRSVNKLLDQIPPGLPHEVREQLPRICQLPLDTSEKISKIKLMALGIVCGQSEDIDLSQNQINEDTLRHDNAVKNLSNIITQFTGKEFKKAFKLYNVHCARQWRNPELKQRIKYSTIYSFIRFLLDYPECHLHNGNIVGLTEKSVRWHIDQNTAREQERLASQKELLEKIAAKPPIALPDAPKGVNIKFLSTGQEILEEGRCMGHCIGSYVTQAANGIYYLFHVEYKGETASVAVTPNGTVQQSQGPRNQPNKASKWAEHFFKEWASGFPKQNEVDKSKTDLAIKADAIFEGPF